MTRFASLILGLFCLASVPCLVTAQPPTIIAQFHEDDMGGGPGSCFGLNPFDWLPDQCNIDMDGSLSFMWTEGGSTVDEYTTTDCTGTPTSNSCDANGCIYNYLPYTGFPGCASFASPREVGTFNDGTYTLSDYFILEAAPPSDCSSYGSDCTSCVIDFACGFCGDSGSCIDDAEYFFNTSLCASGYIPGGSDPGLCPGSAVCGDGNVDAGEECDTSGESATCNDDCTTATCGDGKTNSAAGEDCDDSGESATCNDDCTTATCGDGKTNSAAGEDCDEFALNTTLCDADCTNSTCGDGFLNANASEICDDGGQSPNCDDDCTLPVCGDGNINEHAGEFCEDFAALNCTTNCTLLYCGDGIVSDILNEECDDGGETAECTQQCTNSECGDGIVNLSAGEQCDSDNRGLCFANCTRTPDPDFCEWHFFRSSDCEGDKWSIVQGVDGRWDLVRQYQESRFFNPIYNITSSNNDEVWTTEPGWVYSRSTVVDGFCYVHDTDIPNQPDTRSWFAGNGYIGNKFYGRGGFDTTTALCGAADIDDIGTVNSWDWIKSSHGWPREECQNVETTIYPFYWLLKEIPQRPGVIDLSAIAQTQRDKMSDVDRSVTYDSFKLVCAGVVPGVSQLILLISVAVALVFALV